MTGTRGRRRHVAAAGIAFVCAGTAVSGGVVATSAAPHTAAPAAPPTFKMTIGHTGSAFVYPWGMAWDSTTGTMLTSDYNNYQVRRFTSTGTPDGVYSSKAALGGNQPYGIAVDPNNGNFVVDDLGGYLRYTSTGTLLNSVSAAQEGAFYAPFIAVDPNSEAVYMVQSTGLNVGGSNVVLRFDKNDHFVSQFGSNGRSCGAGQFGLIRGVDVDNSGNVYINDVSNHCVQVFTSGGSVVRSFSTSAHSSSNTRGLALDRANNLVYIADAANQKVLVYTTTGTFKGTIGTPGSDCGGGGQLDGPRDAAIGPDGTVYVSDYTCFSIDAFNPLPSGAFVFSAPDPAQPPPAGGLNQAVGVAVSPDGKNVYVSDTFNQRIQAFQGPNGTAPGDPVQMWGSRQPVLADYCAMDYPRGVAVDPSGLNKGNLWVNDTRSGYIKAYTPGGNSGGPLSCVSPGTGTVSSFGEFGGQVQTNGCISCSPGKFFYSRGIFVGGPLDDVYVTDSSNGRLQVLDQSGHEAPGFPVACGVTQRNPAGYNGCTGVTVDPTTGTIYAASINQGVVDVYNSAGKLQRTIGSGRLGQPFDTALSPDGSILYVTDAKNNDVSEFTPSTGAFIAKFGAKGTANGNLVTPMGIAVDGGGLIYVNDFGNNRIEVYNP